MQIIKTVIPPNCEIVLAGDSHEGSIMKHREGYQEMIDYVDSGKNRRLIHMGDMIEGICADDPRYEYDVIDPGSPKPFVQMLNACEELRPIAKKMIGLLSGNHEFKLQRMGDLAEMAAKNLAIPYGTYSAKFTFLDKKGNVRNKFFCHHGSGFLQSRAKDKIQRDANIKASLKNKLESQAADVALCAIGHTHQLIVVEPAETLHITDDGSRIKQTYSSKFIDGELIHPDYRWYVNTGCFLKQFELGVSGYGERAMYRPSEMGYIVVRLENYEIVDVKRVVV